MSGFVIGLGPPAPFDDTYTSVHGPIYPAASLVALFDGFPGDPKDLYTASVLFNYTSILAYGSLWNLLGRVALMVSMFVR